MAIDPLLPPVSIVMVVRNAVNSVAAAIDSVLEQRYPHLQFVIQDGGSTDGTIEIVESYGSTIDFLSEADGGVNRLWRGLLRASGEVIGTCRADGSMACGAISRAVQELAVSPDAGAVTGDTLVCNRNGDVVAVESGRPFDLLAYLIGEQTPELASSFFRRRALDDIGFFTERWDTGELDSLEFALWCRLGIEHRVKYAPHRFAWRLSASRVSRGPVEMEDQVAARALVCHRYLFGRGTFLGNNLALRDYIVARQQEVVSGRRREPDADDLAYRARLAHDFAMLYRERGQVDEALTASDRAEALNDETIDSIYAQLALASPTVTDRDLEVRQTRWAAKYADPALMNPDSRPSSGHDRPPATVRKRVVKETLRVGYHSSFWNIQTGLSILNPVMASHDRTRVTVIGYCHLEQPRSVTELFDEFHVIGSIGHAEFCQLVRSHDLDVLVETNGLSLRNHLPSMAGRCAPVQVSYVNHLGTCGVANVDYVLADRATIGSIDQAYYGERAYVLDRCFFSHTYRDMWAPPVSPPPVTTNGYITFGSFGGPYKLNPACLELWASVLRRVPGSRLLLQNPGMNKPGNIAFMRKRFTWLGIDPDRLTILPGADRETVLKNYELMDISLDSWPYCGGNTTAEALWQGVPVVTLKGNRFVSAYGASLSLAAGLGDLVADRWEDFSMIASALANDRQRLIDLRYTLRERMVSHGLSDPKAMATALEDAYFDMIRRARGRSA